MTSNVIYNMIVAYDKLRGIGKNNTLPWHFPEDLKRFSKLTKGAGNNAIVMGRNTWISLPKKPLPKRDNLILSTTLKSAEENSDNIRIFSNTNSLHEFCKEKNYDMVWIIGGSQIYKELLTEFNINSVYVTQIDKVYQCDTGFPSLDDWNIISNEDNMINNVKVAYQIYKKDSTDL
jgi:dihydrofolate reductase